VQRHIADLRARDPELAAAYIRTSLAVLETAELVGRVDAPTAAAMREQLR
jgi:hypothetical protein